MNFLSIYILVQIFLNLFFILVPSIYVSLFQLERV